MRMKGLERNSFLTFAIGNAGIKRRWENPFFVLFLFFSFIWSVSYILEYIYIAPLTLAKLYWPGPVQFSCLPLLLVWANVIITSCSSLSLSIYSSFSSLCGCVCVCTSPMMMIIVLNLECRIARTSNQESFPVKKMSFSFRLFSF